MSNAEKVRGAVLATAPHSDNEAQQAYTPCDFSKTKNLNHSNAYLVQSSRFIKRERRDSRLFLSPRFEDYLIVKSDTDLVEALNAEFKLVEVYDELAEQIPKIRELATIKRWKELAALEKTQLLLDHCISGNSLVKDAEYAADPKIRTLFNQCKELPEQIEEITTQINHIQNQVLNQEDWLDPMPFPDELLPVYSFDPALLPEPLRGYALDVSETLQCPVDYVAVGLLSTFSSIIGAGCAIRPLKEGNWTIIPNLWGAIVGPPSAKKTPALNAAMIALAVLEKKADKLFAEEKLKSEVDKIERDIRKKSAKTKFETAIGKEDDQGIECAKTALLSLERESEIPRCGRFKTNDTTIAKLTELLAENPRGLLVFRDELVGFLATLEQEGREDSRAFYLEAWTGWCPSGIKTDRIVRGTTSCNPCISVLGGITTSKLRLYLRNSLANIGNDGFIQRFQLLAFPDPQKEWKLVDRRPDAVADDQVKNIGILLANTDFTSMRARIDGDFPLPIFRFDPEAQERFYNWQEILENRLIKECDEGLIIEHLGKYRSLMPSLALVSYLVRIANGSAPESGVALEDVERAIGLCIYFESHARRVYGLIEHKSVYAAKVLLKKAQEGSVKDGFTQREIYRNCWSGLDRDGIKEACEELVARGWLKEEIIPPPPKGGPRIIKYRLHPRLQKKGGIETDITDE